MRRVLDLIKTEVHEEDNRLINDEGSGRVSGMEKTTNGSMIRFR